VKKSSKKLLLSRSTVRHLAADDLRAANGGTWLPSGSMALAPALSLPDSVSCVSIIGKPQDVTSGGGSTSGFYFFWY